MSVNLDTVYAYAQCLTVWGFCQTREEAILQAKKIEPMQVIHGSDYWEYGYVIEIVPGSISDELYRGSDGKNDLIIWNNDTHYTFGRPQWMRMGKLTPKPILTKKCYNPVFARPVRA